MMTNEKTQTVLKQNKPLHANRTELLLCFRPIIFHRCYLFDYNYHSRPFCSPPVFHLIKYESLRSFIFP